MTRAIFIIRKQEPALDRGDIFIFSQTKAARRRKTSKSQWEGQSGSTWADIPTLTGASHKVFAALLGTGRLIEALGDSLSFLVLSQVLLRQRPRIMLVAGTGGISEMCLRVKRTQYSSALSPAFLSFPVLVFTRSRNLFLCQRPIFSGDAIVLELIFLCQTITQTFCSYYKK